MTAQNGSASTQPKDNLIYHYCSMESFSKIIENKELWLTSYTKMNDTAEGEWITRCLEEYIDNHSFSSDAERKSYDSVLDNMHNHSRHIYLSSFSEEEDSLSQWREYADRGMGIAIGFDLDSFPVKVIESGLEREFNYYDEYYICKVEYKAYDKMAKFLYEYFKTHPYTTQKDARKIGQHLLHWRAIFKNDSFSQEKEWRLVIEPNIFRRQKIHGWYTQIIPLENVKTRITPKGLSTYIPYPILGENQPQIAKVILGPRNLTTEDDLNFFLYRHNLGDVKIECSRSTFCG